MDIRLKAVRRTAGQMALICIASLALVYFTAHVDIDTIINILAVSLFGFGAWLMYRSNLYRMKTEEELQKKLDSKS
jgi:uncharacterized membrane protein YccC